MLTASDTLGPERIDTIGGAPREQLSWERQAPAWHVFPFCRAGARRSQGAGAICPYQPYPADVELLHVVAMITAICGSLY